MFDILAMPAMTNPLYGLEEIATLAAFACEPNVMNVKLVGGVWQVVHTTTNLNVDGPKAQLEWERVWLFTRNEYRQLIAHSNALQIHADELDGDADLMERPKKKQKGMTMTDAWADWILKNTGDERYQNMIRLLRMMMVFSSNSACCERSGSAMSLMKTLLPPQPLE